MSIDCVIVFGKIWILSVKAVYAFDSGLCVFCINFPEFYFASIVKYASALFEVLSLSGLANV